MSWYCDIIDTSNPEHGVLSSGLIAGPSVQVGRKSGIDLCVKSHMSVSSDHAVLTLLDGSLSLTDHSRTGTFVLHRGHADTDAVTGSAGSELVSITSAMATGKGERLAAKELVVLRHGTVIRLGAHVAKKAKAGVMTYALLRFYKKRLALCHTRLDNSSKEYVKAAAAALLAELVPSVEAADVVIATHMSTTVKLLTALALRKKLVTPDWLQFSGVFRAGAGSADAVGLAAAAAARSYREVPADDDGQYLPMVDSGSQYGSQLSQFNQPPPDLSADRSQLLRSFLVCLAHAEDEQYFSILRGCGATAVRLYDSGTRPGVDPLTIDEERLRSLTAPGASLCTVRCLFHDEMHSSKRPKRASAVLQALGFRWMASATLATNVLKALEPALADLPALGVDPSVEVQEGGGEGRGPEATSPLPAWGGFAAQSTSTNTSSSAASAAILPPPPAAAAAAAAAAVSADEHDEAKESAERSRGKASLADASLPSSKRTKRGAEKEKEKEEEEEEEEGGVAELADADTQNVDKPPAPTNKPPSMAPPAPHTAAAATTTTIMKASAATEVEEHMGARPVPAPPRAHGGEGEWETNSELPPTAAALEALAAAREESLVLSPASAARRARHDAAALAAEAQAVLDSAPVAMKADLSAVAPSKTKARARVGALKSGKAAQEDDAWDFGVGDAAQVAGAGAGAGDAKSKHAVVKILAGAGGSEGSDSEGSGEVGAGTGAGAGGADAEGWVTALTGTQARKVLRHKQRQYTEARQAARLAAAAAGGTGAARGISDADNEGEGEGIDVTDDELDDMQPLTSVMEVSAVQPNSDSTATACQYGQTAISSKKASLSAAAANDRDQRKFRKNFVRVALPEEVIAVRDMDAHCHARESERAAAELEAAEQEEEEEAAQHKFNEEIFADRFSVKPPKVSRLRL